MRVVSLIASATEIVYALDLGHTLVARSHECDHPPSVLGLPAVTAPKFPTDGTSYEIDQRVKAILAEGLSVYRVDPVALAAARPEVVLTQVQCEVCAVSLRDVEEALVEIAGGRPRLVALEPMRLDDVWRDMRLVADALDVPARGVALVNALQARLTAICARAAGLARPRVATVEWIEPLMAGGNWMPELVALAGGENLFGAVGQHSEVLSWERFAASDPDVICVLPCGWGVAKARTELAALERQPGWSQLRAVATGRVFLLDGNRYFNRPGPRLVESVEILAELLHPDRFHFGHEGDGWERR